VFSGSYFLIQLTVFPVGFWFAARGIMPEAIAGLRKDGVRNGEASSKVNCDCSNFFRKHAILFEARNRFLGIDSPASKPKTNRKTTVSWIKNMKPENTSRAGLPYSRRASFY